jgi:hypothetical protein
LIAGTSYSFHVRCADGANNANADDYTIVFPVPGALSAATSNFAGGEALLSENGMRVKFACTEPTMALR